MDQDKPNRLMWSRVPPAVGHAMGRVERAEAGWHVAGAEISCDGGQGMSCTFEVHLDVDWHTVDARVSSWSDEMRKLRLTVDHGGQWWQDGALRVDLDGCVDVDVSATPLTNTFPLRRLGSLSCEESATLPVAWVDVPTLQVHRVTQTYKRLTYPDGRNPATWEYSDRHHGAFRLSVDDDGVVVDYESFATRMSCAQI
jgi:uncharacterized protein